MDNRSLQCHSSGTGEAENDVYCLTLTTIAGNDIEVAAPVSIHHCWEMLKDFLVEQLPEASQLETFGCEITLLRPQTHEALSDPIQDTLRTDTRFHLVVQGCFQTYDHKCQIQGEEYEDYPKAVWIPANAAGVVPANAFSSVPRLRHVWAAHC